MREDECGRDLVEDKKRALEQEFGCTFHSGNSTVPPEVEWDWLHCVEEFERQHRLCRQTTVRRFIGEPLLPAPENLMPQQLAGELERLLDLLAANTVIVHFPGGLGEREMYRFLVGELLEEMMDDIRIPGMTHNFLYEDFHPGEEEEVE
jgi:hypothetical protein